MKHLSKNTWLILVFAFTFLLFVSSCRIKNNYSIKGIVVKATTGEPIEGVVVEVYREICQGSLFNGGCGPDPDDFHSATTNAKGEFEMAFTSKQSALELNFKKQFVYKSSIGSTGYIVYPGSSTLNLRMYAETEEFTIEFEPTLSNVKEVTLGLEWDHFSGGSQDGIVLGPLSSLFTIESSAYLSQYSPPIQYSIRYGEQWLKMNFDVLLEDNSRLQKTDSIWLPGRYYEIGFGDGPPNPVYKFRY